MFEHERAVNAQLIHICTMLAADVADEDMAVQPFPGCNHPAWQLGHLALVSDSLLKLLGKEKRLPPEWEALFGRESLPSTDRSQYPSKDILLNALTEGYAAARDAAAEADVVRMQRPNPLRFLAQLNTVGDLVANLLTGHFGMHVGQMSIWRRARGLPYNF